MAFNIFGTFTTGQWEMFKSFTQIQKMDLMLRQKHLQRQLEINGKFVTEYDDDQNPINFSVVPLKSYGDKLLNAYKILGGVPEFDLLLRTRDIPVSLKKDSSLKQAADGTAAGGYSDVFTNERMIRGDQKNDGVLGLKVERQKYWELEAIKLKREKLEIKIKRALDYSDQLQQEIDLIDTLLKDDTVWGSVDRNEVDIQAIIDDPENNNVVQDLDALDGRRIGRQRDLSFQDALSDERRVVKRERGA